MRFLFLSAFALFFVGCATMPPSSTSYSILSIDKIDIPNIKKSDITVQSENCLTSIFKTNLNLESMNFAINKAVADAIENGKKRGFEGDFLADAEIYLIDSSRLIRQKICFIVSGKLASVKKK